jgi:hypothetical protein
VPHLTIFRLTCVSLVTETHKAVEEMVYDAIKSKHLNNKIAADCSETDRVTGLSARKCMLQVIRIPLDGSAT